ncbi:MAG: RDD family protein [Synergistaceae bacterium]|jgi:uncharacterized RDD family membrane protein YckC|nr:RDD family protein [Synergistaceae bacterium]
MEEWHCALYGQIQGPFPEERLREMIKSGELGADTLVWSSAPGNADRGWVKAADTEIAALLTEPYTSRTPHEVIVPSVEASELAAEPDRREADYCSAAESSEALTLATRSQRLSACSLDSLILTLPCVIAVLCFFFSRYIAEYGEYIEYLEHMAEYGRIFSIAARAAGISVLCVSALDVYFLYKSGQTIGKKIVRIRIANLDGTKAPLWRNLLIRTLVFTLLTGIPIAGTIVQIVDVCFIFREDRRMLHDLIAGTIVVQA